MIILDQEVQQVLSINWYAATDQRNICPIGWRVPNYNDWNTLATTLGGNGVAGGKMKGEGSPSWESPNVGSNNSGFTALPVGLRKDNGHFTDEGYKGHFWSSEPVALNYELFNFGAVLFPNSTLSKASGLSVRCIEN